LHKIASEARGPSNIFLSPILGIVPALNQGSFEGSEGSTTSAGRRKSCIPSFDAFCGGESSKK
jgi:hypothetical protein